MALLVGDGASTRRGGQRRRCGAPHVRRSRPACSRRSGAARGGARGRALVGRSSLRLLAYAAEALRERPVLFAGHGASETEPGGPPRLTEALAALAAAGRPAAACPALGSTRWPAALDDVLDPGADLVEVLDATQRRQPFLRPRDGAAAHREGRGRPPRADALDVPDGIADVLRLRMLQLGPERTRDPGGRRGRSGATSTPAVVEAALGRPVLDDLDEAWPRAW